MIIQITLPDPLVLLIKSQDGDPLMEVVDAVTDTLSYRYGVDIVPELIDPYPDLQVCEVLELDANDLSSDNPSCSSPQNKEETQP
jgi:hypothetical protein